jgi:hypothetical protein
MMSKLRAACLHRHILFTRVERRSGLALRYFLTRCPDIISGHISPICCLHFALLLPCVLDGVPVMFHPAGASLDVDAQKKNHLYFIASQNNLILRR